MYTYTGNSILWYKYTPEEGTKFPINSKNIKIILTDFCNNQNPFETEREPKLTKTPQIITAHFLDNNTKVRILFAAEGMHTGAFEGFKYRSFISTEWINCMLRLNDNILEIRSNINLAKGTARVFFSTLAMEKRFIHSDRLIELSEKYIVRLRDELNAKIKSYRGRDKGNYEAREYFVRNGEDLWENEKFQKDDKKGLFDPKCRLIFASTTNDKLKIKVNTISNSITFYSKYISEDDIDTVYNALKRMDAIV